MFAAREKIRRWKAISGLFHLITVICLVVSLCWLLPNPQGKSLSELNAQMEKQIQVRRSLLESLDRMVRYQKYYSEIHGKFTRDLQRLPVPDRQTASQEVDINKYYEISVLDARPNRFLLLATGIETGDRVTIDEGHRVSANFVLPVPTKSYLEEEADRLLRLRGQSQPALDGIYAKFWKFEKEGTGFVAIGARYPILGVRKELEPAKELSSLFATIREKVESRMMGKPLGSEGRNLASKEPPLKFPVELSNKEVLEWLEAARLAQHIHFREKGKYARKWEELDTVSDFQFIERMRVAKNIRVNPIDFSGTDNVFQISLEGISGDLLGEQFFVDKTGSIKQLRYTESLIQQLQETTSILENFQINPIIDPAAKSQP
jgi:hypothetical protein